MINTQHNTTESLLRISGLIYDTLDPKTGNTTKIRLDTQSEEKQLTIEQYDANGDRVTTKGFVLLDINDIKTLNKSVKFRVMRFKDADDNCKKKRFTYIGTDPEADDAA
jgi:hypothetical protein